MSSTPHLPHVAIGIDCGTSGFRLLLMDGQSSHPHVLATSHQSIASYRTDCHHFQSTHQWHQALSNGLAELATHPAYIHCRTLVVAATSGTLVWPAHIHRQLYGDVFCDGEHPIAWMYDHVVPSQTHGNTNHHNDHDPVADRPTAFPTSAWEKCHWLAQQLNTQDSASTLLQHQVDWVNAWLLGQHNTAMSTTDENNALKSGYDPLVQAWSAKATALPFQRPNVIPWGQPLARLSHHQTQHLGFNQPPTLLAGTTDSIAAFFSAIGQTPSQGHCVVSLGTTLAFKALVNRPLFDVHSGLYSHAIEHQKQRQWLVGGASKAGGGTLLQWFDVAQIQTFNAHWQPIGLDWLKQQYQQRIQEQRWFYPINQSSDSFPTPHYKPLPLAQQPGFNQLAPQQQYLEILFGLVHLESLAVDAIANHSQQPIQHLTATGGGTQNPLWMALRHHILPFQHQTASNNIAAGAVMVFLGNLEKPHSFTSHIGKTFESPQGASKNL